MKLNESKFKSDLIEQIIFVIFILLNASVFLNQAYNSYRSDFVPHVKFVIDPNAEASYSLMHILVRKITDIFVIFNSSLSEYYTSLATNNLIIILSLSTALTYLLIKRFFLKSNENATKQLNSIQIQLLVLGILFSSMLIINLNINSNHYLGVWTPNPHHNPTYIFSKPFAVLSFVYLAFFLNKIVRNNLSVKYFIFTAFILLFSMWAKPSFLISFIPAFLSLSFILFIKKQINFSSFIKSILVILPSILPLYIIKNRVFVNEDQGNSVVISLAESWSYFSNNIPLSVLLASAFPLYVFIIYALKFKHLSANLSKFHYLAMLNFFFAIIVMLFFKEVGERSLHANFSWTYSFSLFFIYLMGAELLIFRSGLKQYPIAEKLAYLLLFTHIFSGIFYFAIIFFGYAYK